MNTKNADQALISKINSETAKIPWIELQRFFAAGKAVYVAPDLDLIKTASYFAKDNKEEIEQLMTNGDLGLVSDQQAKEWLENDIISWAAVVSPWVLVQPIDPEIPQR